MLHDERVLHVIHCSTSMINSNTWCHFKSAKSAEDMLNRVPWDLIYQEWWGEYPPQDSWCQRTGFLKPFYGLRTCSFIPKLKVTRGLSECCQISKLNSRSTSWKQFTTKTSQQLLLTCSFSHEILKVEKLHDLASGNPCPMSSQSVIKKFASGV